MSETEENEYKLSAKVKISEEHAEGLTKITSIISC